MFSCSEKLIYWFQTALDVVGLPVIMFARHCASRVVTEWSGLAGN